MKVGLHSQFVVGLHSQSVVGMHSQSVVGMYSQSVVGMLDPVEAGDSFVEHLGLHTGPGNAGSAAAAAILQLAEATNHNLDSGQSGDQDH